MNILLDTGASKCYMSRAYFERNKILHGLPRLKSTIKSLRVGNGNEVMLILLSLFCSKLLDIN